MRSQYEEFYGQGLPHSSNTVLFRCVSEEAVLSERHFFIEVDVSHHTDHCANYVRVCQVSDHRVGPVETYRDPVRHRSPCRRSQKVYLPSYGHQEKGVDQDPSDSEENKVQRDL